MNLVLVRVAKSLRNAVAFDNKEITSERSIGLKTMATENEIFVPEDLSVTRPLLIALHGGGRDSQSQLDLWQSVAAKEQIIVLAPNSKEPPYIQATWFTPDDGQLLVDKVNEVLGRYPVDKSRIYCFGHSVGATKALDWGFHNRHIFAAVAVHSPMQV